MTPESASQISNFHLRRPIQSEHRGGAKVNWKGAARPAPSDETELRPVLAIDDFCALDPTYLTFWHNDWILLSSP